jgi:hypothetical protein
MFCASFHRLINDLEGRPALRSVARTSLLSEDADTD